MSDLVEYGLSLALRQKIREHLNSYADSIAGGSAQDFGDYKYQTGVIAGLALAERELLDLTQEAQDEEEAA
jgi:hypothetical protein